MIAKLARHQIRLRTCFFVIVFAAAVLGAMRGGVWINKLAKLRLLYLSKAAEHEQQRSLDVMMSLSLKKDLDQIQDKMDAVFALGRQLGLGDDQIKQDAKHEITAIENMQKSYEYWAARGSYHQNRKFQYEQAAARPWIRVEPGVAPPP